MAPKVTEKKLDVSVKVRVDGGELPDAVVYACNGTGAPIASALVSHGEANVALPGSTAGSVLDFILAPKGAEELLLRRTALRRLPANRMRVTSTTRSLDIKVPGDIGREPWIPFKWCVVKGRVVKLGTDPDGTPREFPVVNSRVAVYEVDRWSWIVPTLPDEILHRIRDELVRDIVDSEWPRPPGPPPEEIAPHLPGPGPMSARPVTAARPGAAPLATLDPRVRAIAGTTSPVQLRRALADLGDLILPQLCNWQWIEPFFLYRKDLIKEVDVGENGAFDASFLQFGPDQPDLYFTVKQLRGGTWQSIYAPRVRCSTYWDFVSGTDITIVVTEPAAEHAVPSLPVTPPTGVTTWVMPYAVGNTRIQGTAGAASNTKRGWLRPDGFTDYGGVTGAPFGGYIGMRLGSVLEPSSTVTHYRWSYRKTGAVSWNHMTIPVFRHYVRKPRDTTSLELPTFPVYQLGPKTIGSAENLFEFRPIDPPADPDHAYETRWPTDDFAGDIYSAFLDTSTLSGGPAAAAGEYEIRLELFDETGAQVWPATSGLQFIVPSELGPDGRQIVARKAAGSEIDDGAFVFKLQIDNNRCVARTDSPVTTSSPQIGDCGFLKYSPGDLVTLHFGARHPNGRATFHFWTQKGRELVLSTSGEVTALTTANVAGDDPANPSTPPNIRIATNFTGDGEGEFDLNVGATALLGAGTHDCAAGGAAFANRLEVYAKATTGWGDRIHAYDAAATEAFALLKKP